LLSVLLVFCAAAYVVVPFPGWDRLAMESEYIALVRCGNPTVLPPNAYRAGPNSDSDIQIIFTLKGTNDLDVCRLITDHDLYPGERYLVFGNLGKNILHAFEEYRITQVDHLFTTNLIAGKPLNEQIQIILERRLFDLNREAKLNEEELQRLNEALKNEHK